MTPLLTFNINNQRLWFVCPMLVLSSTVICSTLRGWNWWDHPLCQFRRHSFIFEPGKGGKRISFGWTSKSHSLSFHDVWRAYFSLCVFRSVCINTLNTSKKQITLQNELHKNHMQKKRALIFFTYLN